MQNVHKLAVYREARDLAVAVYRLTEALPSHERFGSVPQMRRAAVSIGSNIAEGCGRKGGRALLPFLHYAIGSTNELAFQLEIAESLGFCSPAQMERALANVVRTRRMLIRLAESVEKRCARSRGLSPTTHDPLPTTRDSSPALSPCSRASAVKGPSP
jgi:four helix bundle protein